MAAKVESQISDALFRLAVHSLNEKPCESAVVSPFSIAMALATVNAGAKGVTSLEITEAAFAGIPKNQITAWFRERITDLKEEGLSSPLAIASAIYLERTLGLVERYQTELQQSFDSRVHRVDFTLEPELQREVMNMYVEGATKGHISELFHEGDITSDTRIVAVNALYLKSNFAQEFEKELTKEEPFYNEDGSNKQVPTMNGIKKGRFFENDDFAYAEFPFMDCCFDFFFAVPKAGSLAELKKNFYKTQHLISSTISDSEPIPYIHVALPKFKAEAGYSLKTALEKHGIREMFVADKADLSGITDEPITVESVIHQAVFDLNEDGVEASAATAVMACGRCLELSQEERHIRADRPFLYGVIYKGAPLFVGQFY
uniref:SERPIN domain-containing protein n=2 Tax=Steinernema glaseri TaxID=37863 RepID=A0A1I8AAW7_9BILA